MSLSSMPSSTSDTASGASTLSTVRAHARNRSNSISDDGRFAVFVSSAPNLVAGQVDANQTEDVFLFDAQTNVVTLVSHIPGDPLTTGNNSSFEPVISANGQNIAFASEATNLVTGTDNNDGKDVFVSNSGVVNLVSHVPGDVTRSGNDLSLNHVISADGQSIAFESWATDLVTGFADNNGQDRGDVFVSDSGVVSLVSHIPGNPLATGDGPSGNPLATGDDDSSAEVAISADGQSIAFSSGAADLVAGDNNGLYDVFVSNAGVVSLVSHTPSNPLATSNGASSRPAISADGQSIAFWSDAPDLVTGFADNNGEFTADVFVSNSGVVSLVSHVPGNITASGNNLSFDPVISADGQSIAFASRATDLVAGTDNNGDFDVFVSKSGTVNLVSHIPGDVTKSGNGFSLNHVISADGQSIAFSGEATDLVTGDNNGSHDVFVWNSGVVILVSHIPGDTTATANDGSGRPAISADGSRILYPSAATNLETGINDANGSLDLIDYTVATTVNRYVSRVADAGSGSGGGGTGGDDDEDKEEDFGIGAVDPFALLLFGVFALRGLAQRRRQSGSPT